MFPTLLLPMFRIRNDTSSIVSMKTNNSNDVVVYVFVYMVVVVYVFVYMVVVVYVFVYMDVVVYIEYYYSFLIIF